MVPLDQVHARAVLGCDPAKLGEFLERRLASETAPAAGLYPPKGIGIVAPRCSACVLPDQGRLVAPAAAAQDLWEIAEYSGHHRGYHCHRQRAPGHRSVPSM